VGLFSERHGLHHSAQLDDLIELFGVHKASYTRFPAGFEQRLLVNRFRGMGNLLSGARPSLRWPRLNHPKVIATRDDRLPPRAPLTQRCQIRSIAHHCSPLGSPLVLHSTGRSTDQDWHGKQKLERANLQFRFAVFHVLHSSEYPRESFQDQLVLQDYVIGAGIGNFPGANPLLICQSPRLSPLVAGSFRAMRRFVARRSIPHARDFTPAAFAAL